MRNFYSTTIIASSSDDKFMTTPRKSTVSFLRNFARAYAYMPETGSLVYN